MSAPADWPTLAARLRATEAAYREASAARDEYVLAGRLEGVTLGELRAITGLDRAQLVRMTARALKRIENRSHVPEAGTSPGGSESDGQTADC